MTTLRQHKPLSALDQRFRRQTSAELTQLLDQEASTPLASRPRPGTAGTAVFNQWPPFWWQLTKSLFSSEKD